jgi:RNA polymerase sigma factor (sigma-70 family)
METNQSINHSIIANLYRNIRGEVYAIFRSKGIVEEDCQDLVQDVFLKMLGVDMLDESHVKGFAISIAYNLRCDYLRHKFFVGKVISDQSTVNDLVCSSYFDDTLEVRDLRRIEKTIVSRMSELDRKTYVLSRFEDKKAQEIALTLQLTCRSVESRLYRTRLKVRQSMALVVNG